MIPPISRSARLTWAQLDGRDFDAVDDLVATMSEVIDDGHWDRLDRVADLEIADFQARVVQARRLAVLIEPATYQIFAIGRPDTIVP